MIKNAKEVYPDIFQIVEDSKISVFKPPANIYVIAGKNGLVFDAGYGNFFLFRKFYNSFNLIKKKYLSEKRAFNVNRVFISHSHPDHSSGLLKIKKKLGMSVILTSEMQETLSSGRKFIKEYEESIANEKLNILIKIFHPISKRMIYFFYKLYYHFSFSEYADQIISVKDTLLINDEEWKILATPGHSKDHISLYNQQKGILFAGDNVLRTVTPWLGPPNSDLQEYLDTLLKLKNLPNLKLILGGHGSPIENPAERIQELIDWRLERVEHICSIINSSKNKSVTIKEIVKKLYPDGPRKKAFLAKGWVKITLIYLEKKGRIKHHYFHGHLLFKKVKADVA